jgi:hypothetical protein
MEPWFGVVIACAGASRACANACGRWLWWLLLLLGVANACAGASGACAVVCCARCCILANLAVRLPNCPRGHLAFALHACPGPRWVAQMCHGVPHSQSHWLLCFAPLHAGHTTRRNWEPFSSDILPCATLGHLHVGQKIAMLPALIAPGAVAVGSGVVHRMRRSRSHQSRSGPLYRSPGTRDRVYLPGWRISCPLARFAVSSLFHPLLARRMWSATSLAAVGLQPGMEQIAPMWLEKARALSLRTPVFAGLKRYRSCGGRHVWTILLKVLVNLSSPCFGDILFRRFVGSVDCVHWKMPPVMTYLVKSSIQVAP